MESIKYFASEYKERPWKLEEFPNGKYNLTSPSGILWNYKEASLVSEINPLYQEAKEAERIFRDNCN